MNSSFIDSTMGHHVWRGFCSSLLCYHLIRWIAFGMVTRTASLFLRGCTRVVLFFMISVSPQNRKWYPFDDKSSTPVHDQKQSDYSDRHLACVLTMYPYEGSKT